MFGSHRTPAALRRALPVLVALALLVPARAIAQYSSAGASGNELVCLVLNTGDVCHANWPSFGYWPRGTANLYVYGAGLVVAGIVDESAFFSWAGDTVPARFFDIVGTSEHGTPVTNVYSSEHAQDLAAWPVAGSIQNFPFATGTIVDEDLFSPIHLGDEVASELDTWTLYWDGNPGLNARRLHPMGVAVEQRTMQWNAPDGLQSIIFLIYRVTNVTNLPVFRAGIVEGFFDGDSTQVPASGWALDSVFVGFATDFDVTTDATENHSLLVPSFGLNGAYHTAFVAPEFDFRADIFYPPFFTDAPGLVGAALVYADLPGNAPVQTRIMSEYDDQTCFGCEGGIGLWHDLSGQPGTVAGVAACGFQDPIERGICYGAAQFPRDVKSWQSVGPWRLEAGQSATVVYALVAAPTVEVPGIVQGVENGPGIPAIAPGCNGDEILPIELAAGWVSTPVCPALGERIDPDLVETVPGSLLHRIQVARAFAANGFLAPLAPEQPEFFLVPTDSAVHVVWERSPTEAPESGDPFHDVASDSTTPLYNPNYRSNDVEGYRVYRSIDGVNWELRAQFDYAGLYTDMLCETDKTHVAGAACTDTVQVATRDDGGPYYGYFVQYRPGDIVESAGGQPIVLDADTASAGYFHLSDYEPEFVYTDTDVRAGFRYFYQVRAFDLNSYRSGPSSLESGSATKSIVIQPDFANRVAGSLSIRLEGADGTVLDPDAPLPTIDAATGVFSGPMPPTNGIEATLQPIVADLMPDVRLVVTIDSVSLILHDACPPGEYGGGATISQGACWHMYVTTDHDGVVAIDTIVGYTPLWDSFGEPGATDFTEGVATIGADSARLDAVGALEADFGMEAALRVQTDEAIWNSTWEGQSNRRIAAPNTHNAGGSRWFAGPNETVADPAIFVRVGDLPGVDTIWSPDVHHTQTPTQFTGFPSSAVLQQWGYSGFAQIARAADLRVTWQNGTITVEDVTHHVPVPFDPSPTGQSWAFVPDGNDNGMIDGHDFFYLSGVADLIFAQAGATVVDPASAEPGSATPIVMGTDIQGGAPAGMVAGANGFGLLINTQRFIFRTNGVPANGTVWTLRTYHGLVTATDANTSNPSNYAFVASGTSGAANGILQIRPPFVPGLRVVYEGVASSFEGTPDLSRVHTVPDPYYYHSVFGATAQDRGRVLRFVNLPPAATIRIYSLAGVLVDVIHHDDPASGIATWDLRTRDGNTAAPGVYFFHVTAPGSDEHIGRFTIVTSGQYIE